MMKATDLPVFQAEMARLEARLGVVPPPLSVDVWWDDLKPYRIAEVCEAIKQVGQEYKFATWPPIAFVLEKLSRHCEEPVEEPQRAIVARLSTEEIRARMLVIAEEKRMRGGRS
jgi:hypothetical protein